MVAEIVIVLKIRNEIYLIQSDALRKQVGKGIQVVVIWGMIELKRIMEEETKEKEGRIFITDCGEIADFLIEKDKCVIAFLHETSKEENFSKCAYAIESLRNLDMDYFNKVYQRYIGQPWLILQTDRCIVRETTLKDVPDFYRIYREPSITKYMDNLFPGEEEELSYTKTYIETVYKFYGYGMWTVTDRSSGKVIGRAGLSHREGYDTVELGFVIEVDFQRKGYAEEVCRAILNYAEKELFFKEVQALVKKANLASISLCEKLGFSYAGEVKNDGEVYERYLWEVGKPMIVTVTMNPALDKTIEVKTLKTGRLNEVVNSRVDGGGKGINVSVCLKKLGRDTLAVGFAGGNTGQQILATLDKEEINYDFCYLEDESRINMKIIEASGRLTELNEKGPRVNDEQLNELFQKIKALANGNTIFVLSGSVPCGIDVAIYGNLIEAIREKGGRVLLDASGELLRLGIEAQPDIIKPNREELITYFHLQENCPTEELVQHAFGLLEKGIFYILLTLGSEGAYFLSKEESCYCPPIPVQVESTVGAGDAIAAGWTYALGEELCFEEAVRLSVAMATGAVMTKGTNPPNGEVVKELFNKVTIIPIDNQLQ